MPGTSSPTAAGSVYFVTLGCPKNEADTSHMQALVRDAGVSLAPALDTADVVVVNTCSFITEATEESIDVILDMISGECGTKPGAKVIVAGCLPGRYGHDLEGELPEVAAFLPEDQEEDVAAVVAKVLGHGGAPAPGGGIASAADDRGASAPGGAGARNIPATTARTLDGVSAYIKIADGCDRFCTFCTIPFIRGRYHSRTPEEIYAEAAGLVDAGARELVLIAQDTSIWGRDLDSGEGCVRNLEGLLGMLADAFPQTWLRVMYLQPEAIDDKLLETMASHPNICNYLEMPLQHSCGRVLSEMNRKGDGAQFLALIEHARDLMPGVAIRTTFIAGFPGETEDEFMELERFIGQACFDYAGVFPYSQEDGTVAGARADQVPEEARIRRANALRALGDDISFARSRMRIGDIVDVLFEAVGEEDGERMAFGRMMSQAPDVDGSVHVKTSEQLTGQVCKVRLVDSFCYEYEGELVS